MREHPAKPSGLPSQLQDGPGPIVTRLRGRLFPIRSVWFPTLRELRGWRESGVPLYVRVLGPQAFEVGPRLQSMWASAFSPVYAGRIEAAEDGAQVRWSRRWPRFTLALLVGWWILLAAWPPLLAAQIQAGDDHAGWLPFWAFLVLSSTAGAGVGWVMGGRELDAAVPWLTAALTQPEVGEDW